MANISKIVVLDDSEAGREFTSVILDTTEALIVVLDPKGRITHFNKACERLTGFSEIEVKGRKVWDFLIPPEDLAGVRQQWEALRAGDFPNQHENYWLIKDGSRHLIAWSNTALVRPNGEIEYIIGTGQDITEGRRAERELQASNERFRSVLENSLDAAYRRDLRTDTYDYLSPVIKNVLGISPDEMRTMSVSRFIERMHPEDRERARQAVAEGMRSLKGRVEYRFRTDDGQYRWVADHFAVQTDSAGVPVSRSGIVRDVTEQKQAEQALRRSEERFRLLVEQAVDGIFVSDAQGHYLHVNSAGCQMLGYSREEILSRTITHLIAEEEVPRVAAEIARFAGGGVARSEWRFRRKDGSFFMGEVVGRELPDGRLQAILRDITERKRAEEASRRYELLANYSRDIILFVNCQDGRLLEANSAAVEAYGYSREELLTLAILDLRAVETRGLTVGQMTVADELGIQFETVHRRKDGSTFPVEVSSRGALMGDSHILISMVRDITERKRAEEALRRTTERFALLSETAEALLASSNPQALVEALCHKVMRHLDCDVFFNFLADEATGRLRLNSHAGVSAQEARQVEWLDYGASVCGCAARDCRTIIAEAIQDTPDQRTELVQSLGVQAYCCHPLMAGERLIGTLGFGTRRRTRFEPDEVELMRVVANQVAVAMERMRAEEQLRYSEERFRAFFDLSATGAAKVDAVTSRFVRVNQKFAEMIGYSPAELLNMTFLDITHPEDRHLHLERHEKLLRGEIQDYDTEKRYVRKDGQVVWSHVAVALVRDAAGKPLRTIAVIQDITERKEFQANLERLVAERTAKLQELVAELEHFSYTITHDMRAPLRGMRGFAEMIADHCAACSKPEIKEFLQRITVSADRMDNLIVDALNYNKAVRQELPLEPVDVSALLRGMLESYPELQPSKAHIELEGDFPLVMGNEAGLTQCFSNLLGNAAKFVKPGQKPAIRIWAQQQDGWVQIWIEDNGIGIPPLMLPRVFDMFSRGHRSYEGTGIGLALVRKVMDRMGGKVGVESKEGQGSQFWLRLKLGSRQT